jgi:hypothetical protein
MHIYIRIYICIYIYIYREVEEEMTVGTTTIGGVGLPIVEDEEAVSIFVVPVYIRCI